MDTRTVRVLRGAVAALVFATAAFHLWWGLPRSIIYLQALESLTGRGLPPDPRPFLFVAMAALLFAGPYLVTRKVVGLRDAYIAGIVVLLGSVVAWVFWHTTGHGAFLVDGFSAPSAGGGGHHHDRSTVALVLDHFVVEPVEGVVKVVELSAIAIFVTLLWKDPAIIPDEHQPRTDASEGTDN